MAFEDGVAVGVGAGADTGAGGGGDSGGDWSTGGDFEPEVPSGDEGDAGDSGDVDGAGAEAQEFETDPETGEAKLDAEGNPIAKTAKPADFKTTHAKLKEVDSKAAEVYRKTHFEAQQYKSSFPTPAAAQEAKQALETYGGVEGIETISTQAQQFAKEMDGFSKSDPDFFAQLAKDDAEGFAGGATPYLNALHKSNPEAYNSTLTPILSATMESSGFGSGLSEVGNFLDTLYGELKSAGVTGQLPGITAAYKQIKSLWDKTEKWKADTAKAGERPLNDREKRVADREKAFESKAKQEWLSGVQTKTVSMTDGHIDKALAPYFKQVSSLTTEQKQDLHTGVFEFVAQQMRSDKVYGKQLRTYLDAGNDAKALELVNQNVQKWLKNGAAKTVWNRRGFGKQLPAAAKTGNSGNAGVTNLSAKPKNQDINWDKTTETEYMSGSATLKGSGKKVKWDWSKI